MEALLRMLVRTAVLFAIVILWMTALGQQIAINSQLTLGFSEFGGGKMECIRLAPYLLDPLIHPK